MTSARTGLARWLVAFGLLLAARPAYGQILPPIYKPLPVEEAVRSATRADSLRARAAELTARAEVLEGGARTLRQNGVGVAEKLAAQAARLGEEAGRLETGAASDAGTARALRAQQEEFARRGAERGRRMEEVRAGIASLAAPPPVAELAAADSAARAIVAARTAELQAELRADSQTVATFAEQSARLRAQADSLEGRAASARARAAELRAQATQLSGYAAEIRTGRGSSEPTAVRLDQEAASLRAGAQQLARDGAEQAVLAERLRLQADRLWMPVRSREEAMRFFGEDGRAVLRNLVLSVGGAGGAGSLNTELVSDYAGPVRIGVGMVLAELRGGRGAETADSTAPAGAALERFYAGGGNAVVYGSWPMLFHRSAYHSFTVQTLGKVALDVPGTGRRADAATVPANVDVGAELYTTFNTFGSRIRAFGLLRGAYAHGNAPFRRNLGREVGGFPYAQLTFGAEVATVAKVLLSGAHAAEGLGRGYSLTFQLAPNR